MKQQTAYGRASTRSASIMPLKRSPFIMLPLILLALASFPGKAAACLLLENPTRTELFLSRYGPYLVIWLLLGICFATAHFAPRARKALPRERSTARLLLTVASVAAWGGIIFLVQLWLRALLFSPSSGICGY